MPFLKTLSLTFFLLAGSFMVRAQQLPAQPNPRNVVRIAPLGFINKLRLHYERVLGEPVSVGVIGTGYYGLFEGIKAEPFLRLYITNPAPRGLYFQAKMSYGSYSADLCKNWDENESHGWDFDRHATPEEEEDCLGRVSFSTVGADIGLGAQGLIGKKKRTVIDFSLSLQYNPLRRSFRDKLSQTGFGSDWKTAWYLLYGGAIVAPMFSIGRTF